MINSFLVTLTNSATQPVNPSSQVGDVLWPDNVLVKTYTGQELLAYEQLFGDFSTLLEKFQTAIRLLWIVEESVCADKIIFDDPRITYTREQLVGQFDVPSAQTSAFGEQVFNTLRDVSALEFLQGDLLLTYRSSLSMADKVAALISHFGLRND